MKKNIVTITAFSIIVCFTSVHTMEQKLNPYSQSFPTNILDPLFVEFIRKTWPSQKSSLREKPLPTLDQFFNDLDKEDQQNLLTLNQERARVFQQEKNSFFGDTKASTSNKHYEKDYSLFNGPSINSILLKNSKNLFKLNGILTPDLLDLISPHIELLCGKLMSDEINTLKKDYRIFFNEISLYRQQLTLKDEYIVNTLAKTLKVTEFFDTKTNIKKTIGITYDDRTLFIRPLKSSDQVGICIVNTQTKKILLEKTINIENSRLLHSLF